MYVYIYTYTQCHVFLLALGKGAARTAMGHLRRLPARGRRLAGLDGPGPSYGGPGGGEPLEAQRATATAGPASGRRLRGLGGMGPLEPHWAVAGAVGPGAGHRKSP